MSQKPIKPLHRRHPIFFLRKIFNAFLLCINGSLAFGQITTTATVINPTCVKAFGHNLSNVSNGSILVSAAGGTPPYAYELFAPSFVLKQNNGYFPALDAAPYYVQITDATGLIAYYDATLTYNDPIPSLDFMSYLNSPQTCTSTDGIISLEASGGTPPYTYSIDGGVTFSTTNSFPNLTQGYYLGIIKDANGCLAKNQPGDGMSCLQQCGVAAFGSLNITACANDGIVLSYGSHSDVPFHATDPWHISYDGVNFRRLNDPPSEDTISNASPGIAHVYIQDTTTGTIAVGAFTIVKSCFIYITFIGIDASCHQSDGAITVTATNGATPYTYTIDGVHYQSSNVFTGLASGNYSVTVKDANGEMNSITATVYDKCPVITVMGTDANCGQSNGSITATGTRGTIPYQFSIDGINFQYGNLFAGLMPGYYKVKIQDANGFQDSTNIAISNDCPQLTLNIVNGTCSANNGSITATGTNGFIPYKYAIDGVNFQPGNVFSNLAPGNYTITMKDIDGTIVTSPALVGNTPGPSITALAVAAGCPGNDGSISVSGLGGVSPYAYSIDGFSFQPANIFNGLTLGPYTAMIRDANGCTASQPVTVTMNDNLTVNAGPDSTICQGDDIRLQASSNGSSFSWSPATSLDNTNTLDPTANPQTTIVYTLQATWGLCQHSDNMTVTVLAAPTVYAGRDTILCPGESVQLNGAGGQTYLWTPDTYLDNNKIADPLVDHPLGSITYHLSVIDVNGCQSLNDDAVTVQVLPPPKIFAGNDTTVLANQPVQLRAVDVNNIGFNQYQWSPNAGLNNPDIANPITKPAETITYTVTASNAEGCQTTGSVSLKVFRAFNLYVPGAFSPNGDGHNDLLKVMPVGIKEFKYFAVYNRYGQRIFYTEDPGAGWDGALDGKAQNTGVYVWMTAGIAYNGQSIERKGTVILIR